MTHKEILAAGRAILRRAGYGTTRIDEILPYWVDGFKRGTRSIKKNGRPKKTISTAVSRTKSVARPGR